MTGLGLSVLLNAVNRLINISVNVDGSKNYASIFSKKGQKGVNQDCCLVWEEYGYQEDMIFCGIFDEHGPWGHFVAKRVRKSMPSSLLSNWQESLAQSPLDVEKEKEHRFSIWNYGSTLTRSVLNGAQGPISLF
ncbi:hypothetical protein PIB30_040400 [Stylosanthes scabra]|uniref:Uncharacterized protein n=1 Tax=Stylosanthes scabra TaxID=79078 RepID=A0ABU6QE21_9FABA|nr:hypothetical protein [Stylosanthes scabra]